jgi:hypothetical protein
VKPFYMNGHHISWIGQAVNNDPDPYTHKPMPICVFAEGSHCLDLSFSFVSVMFSSLRFLLEFRLRPFFAAFLPIPEFE